MFKNKDFEQNYQLDELANIETIFYFYFIYYRDYTIF